MRTVSSTVVLQHKLTKRRQGLVEGRHAPPPPSLPPGWSAASGPPRSPAVPAAGRVALRRTERSQSFSVSPRLQRASQLAPPRRVSSFPTKPPPEHDQRLFARVEMQMRDRSREVAPKAGKAAAAGLPAVVDSGSRSGEPAAKLPPSFLENVGSWISGHAATESSR